MSLVLEVVTDVERYPEFLPWCKSARIISDTDDEMIVDMRVKFGLLSGYYRSVVKIRNCLDKGCISVEAVSNEGVFSYMRTLWNLKAGTVEKNETTVEFEIEFEFKSKLYQGLALSFFSNMCSTMVGVFERRVLKLDADRCDQAGQVEI